MLRRLMVKISFGLGGILIAVFFLEIGLRLADVSYPSFNIWDDDQGTALRPGAKGWLIGEGGKLYLQISSAGLRDVEHTKSKPSDSLRIAILGDSYAEASQLPMKQAFWYVLQEELRGCNTLGGRKVEVINFGVSGYGTAQELMALRHHVWEYSPDIVLLAFTTGNDIRNNSRALEQDPMRPYFVYRGNELVLDDTYRDLPAFRARKTMLAHLGYLAIDYSRVLQVINQVKNNIRTNLKVAEEEKLQPVAAVGDEVGLDNMVYVEPKDPLWQEAWHVTEGILLLMRDEVKAKGAGFLVVTLSNGIQVHPNPAMRKAFSDRLGVRDLFYSDFRIKRLGDREGFPVLNLAPILQSYAESHKVYLHGFGIGLSGGHWNSAGHRLAGEIIAQHLCPALVSTRRVSLPN
jgi:hypothetical protein